MKTGALLVALLFAPTVANAHCYKVWKYPTHQRCLASNYRHAYALATPKPKPVATPTNPLPDVAIPDLIAPDFITRDERAKALEKLKLKMKEQTHAAQ